MNRSIGDELSGLEGREEKKKRKKEKKKRRVEEQMRVSRLAKSWNTLVAIRSKILSKLSSLLPPPLLPSFSALFIELVRII